MGGPQGECMVFGDPHVLSFDGQRADYYTKGQYWIVKSDTVKIQGLYEPTPITNGLSVTKAIAISGKFLKDHRLIINSLDTPPVASYDGEPIISDFPADYKSPD